MLGKAQTGQALAPRIGIGASRLCRPENVPDTRPELPVTQQVLKSLLANVSGDLLI
jgi:hypothetical protein